MQLWFMEEMTGVHETSESTESKECSIQKESCQEKPTGIYRHLGYFYLQTCLLQAVAVTLRPL
jgi:hypothetical protein